ncbi:MAG: site-specific DNA-methyltransferase [Planctomycetes bacterium]|nr:site-specific DNA-methyltransferase [Planctomycetota bacterium]
METQLGRIHNVDCVKGLYSLPAGSIDLVFADPPFNIGYDYDVYDDRRSVCDYLTWSKQWIEGVRHALKATGTFWLAIGDEYAAELKVLCTGDLGFHCRSWVIWFYTFGVHCNQKFTRSHAHLFQFVKDPRRFTFNASEIRVPSARQLVYGDKRAAAGGRMPDDTWMVPAELPKDTPLANGFVLRPQDIPDRFPPHSDTWYFARVAGTFAERRGWHGCQMPEQLLGRIIRASSNEGDVVLDPFGGSGTTLAVAKKLGRRFVGFELSKSYAIKIEERLAATNIGDPLVGPENPELSSPTTKSGRRLVTSQQKSASIEKWNVSDRLICSAPAAHEKVTCGQAAVPSRELSTAIAEAFIASHDGYSADRVVADPELNERFLAICTKRGIPGDVAEWNRALLNLRKKGALAAIDTSRRTCMRVAEMDSFVYASEVAWKTVENLKGSSLDEIICDPELSALFDKIARRISPNRSVFEYRWAALAVRKMVAKGDRIRGRVGSRLSRMTPLGANAILPSAQAHYVLSHDDQPLFVGLAANLRLCTFLDPLRVEAAASELGVKNFSSRHVRLAYQILNPLGFKRTEFAAARRFGLVERLHPIGNIKRPEKVA